jgi:raffinose/stachyose/melibiose transport system permease protein
VRSRSELVWTNLILAAAVVFALGPVAGVVLVALQAHGSVGGGVTSLTDLSFSNFVGAWNQAHFDRSLRSSAIVVGLAVPIATALSTLAGYGLGLMRFPARILLYGLFVFALMIPIEATMIPLFYMWQSVRLTDTYWAIVLTEVGYHMPFGAFWMAASFRAVPRELIETARIDGAGSWQTLWSVALPIVRPAMLTLGALQFMWVWNDFLMPLVLINSEDKRTAPLGISVFQGQYLSNLSLIAAACVIVALPVVVAYVILQRQFVAGSVSGALKG